MSEKQIIEINGIKMEVDLRHATRLDTFKVGSKVKLLEKDSYSKPEIRHGVVVGFEPFESQPTIIVCYLKFDYSEAAVKFAYINEASRDKWELVASVDDDLPIQKQDVLSRIDREVEKKQQEIVDLERKRDYFLKHFNTYFEAEKA